MHARSWLALACAAGGLLIWWLAAREGGKPRAVAHAAPPAAEVAREPVGLADAPVLEAPAPTPLTVEGPDAPASRPEPRQPLETTPAPVTVRVRLALASGEPGSFDGWLVEAQSWRVDTDETFPHEARANAAGLALFTFPGFVHIDWLRCVPPPESGLALAFSEHHVDLDPGEALEETLELERGGVLGTRVVDLDGQPVAGARVHAYSEGMGYDLTSWQPGIVSATTGADGRVELSPLPPGEWCLGVEPDRWLQIEPDLDNGLCFEVERGVRAEDLDIEVVALHRFRLSVLDAQGRPVEGAEVQFTPRELRAPGLSTRSPAALELFLGRAPLPEEGGAPRVWPYDTLVWSTDARGEAELFGPEGSWELRVVPLLGRDEGASDEVLRRGLALPCPDQTVRLPAALLDFHARVQDVGGRPIEGVEIELERAASGGSASARSARDGSFELRGLQPGVECRLVLTHSSYVPNAWSLWTTMAPEPPVFELRRAKAVRVRLTDPAGNPVPGRPVSISSLLPDEPPAPAESAWSENNRRGTRTTDGAGRIQYTQLPPGRVELQLLLPFTSRKGPGVEMEAFQSWIVPVQDDEQTLVVDLARYVPPAPRNGTHTGIVLDAGSGAPIAGAWVLTRFATGQNWARTSAEGRFSLPFSAVPHSLSIVAIGHRVLELPEQEWPIGVQEHRFTLEVSAQALAVEFVDRDGVRLPRVQVVLQDESGKALPAWVRTTDGPFFSNGQRIPTSGRLVLESQAIGRVRFELDIDGHVLGKGEVEVGSGRAPAEARVQLERSLAEMRAEIERASVDAEDEDE